MKDQRIAHFRGALEALVESLDATARLSRWDGGETAPEPLQQSAAKLGERLGAANRLASCKFIDSKPAEREEAAVALDAEIGSVRTEVEGWA
jgi:hypothetical protein